MASESWIGGRAVLMWPVSHGLVSMQVSVEWLTCSCLFCLNPTYPAACRSIKSAGRSGRSVAGHVALLGLRLDRVLQPLLGPHATYRWVGVQGRSQGIGMGMGG